MHLPAVLLAAVLPLLVSACAPVTPNVSLLFQNDGNWTVRGIYFSEGNK
jgi:hypothetical protein